MGSLEVVHVPQNGIKDEGMTAFLSSLADGCAKLRVLRVNDNWLKSGAISQLFKVISSCVDLEELNISDLNMGQEGVTAALEALKASEQTVLRHFLCNYNDVESGELARRCTSIMMDDLAPREKDGNKLENVEFVGCDCLKNGIKMVISNNLNKALQTKA